MLECFEYVIKYFTFMLFTLLRSFNSNIIISGHSRKEENENYRNIVKNVKNIRPAKRQLNRSNKLSRNAKD